MPVTAYYNEIDRFCCDWLSNLMDANLITPGKIDDRSIVDVRPDDLAGFERVHFFAGVGGWEYALDLAGWSGPVWTGSCPCQPFSVAGRRRARADDRHLWPEFFRLISDCEPPVIFGEQVTGTAGREWLAGVRTDMEALGYACGSADLCAASIGAPHPRQRLYWMADADQARWSHAATGPASTECNRVGADGMGRWIGHWDRDGEQGRFADGSQRRTKSGMGIMVDGFPGRVGTVGAFGNAIVPQLAAEFIIAASEAMT